MQWYQSGEPARHRSAFLPISHGNRQTTRRLPNCWDWHQETSKWGAWKGVLRVLLLLFPVTSWLLSSRERAEKEEPPETRTSLKALFSEGFRVAAVGFEPTTSRL